MVLIVEDEAVSRKALQHLLKLYGLDARTAGSAEEAMQILAAGSPPTMALVDIDLPGMSGIEFVRSAHRLYPGLPCVYMTSADVLSSQQQTPNSPEPLLHKPLDIPHLLRLILKTPGTYRTPSVAQ